MTTTLQESPTPDLAQIFRNYPTRGLLRLGLNSSLPTSLPLRLLSPASTYIGYRALLVTRLPLSFQKRHLNPAPQPRMELPSPERVLLHSLAELKHDKWGFVIYRCTYQDDHAWERFKQNIYGCTQKFMEMSDTPEAAKSLRDSLEWTFVEDREALDGASRSQLRERFNVWSVQAIVTEQPRAKAETERNPEPTFGIPRYHYFIQADDEALQSVLAAPEFDLYGKGFINFVDSRDGSLWATGPVALSSRALKMRMRFLIQSMDARRKTSVG